MKTHNRLLRKHLGGRAESYERRNLCYKRTRCNAPMWTAPAAKLALMALENLRQENGGTPRANLMDVLLDRGGLSQIARQLPSCAPHACRRIVGEVLEHHKQRLTRLGAAKDVRPMPAVQQCLDAALRQMRKRAAELPTMEALSLQRVERRSTRDLAEYLSADPSTDRAHSLEGRLRVLATLKQWDLTWLEGHDVINFERHAKRVGKRPGVAALKGMVRRRVLATAVRNRGDHYLLLSADGPVRLLSVHTRSRRRSAGPPSGGRRH